MSVFTLRSNNLLPTRWITKKHMTITISHKDSESNLNKNLTKSMKFTIPKNNKPTFLKEKSLKHKNNSKISWDITIKFKLTIFSLNLILLSLKFKLSLLKIMSLISKKLKRNKIFLLIPWTNKVKDWKNKRTFLLLKSYHKKNKLNKPEKFLSKHKPKWKKLLQAKRVFSKDGRNQSWWCKRRTQQFKLWERESMIKMKRMFYLKAKYQELELKFVRNKNWLKNWVFKLIILLKSRLRLKLKEINLSKRRRKFLLN